MSIKRTDGIPRKNDIRLCFPAEVAIAEAMAQVETLGADEKLTDASEMLDLALDLVAQYLESQLAK